MHHGFALYHGAISIEPTEHKAAVVIFVLSCRDVFFIILNSSCTYHGVRAAVLQDEKYLLTKASVKA